MHKGIRIMNKQLGILSAAILAMSVSAGAVADTIVDWNLDGTPGTQPAQAVASAAAHVIGGSISRGAGLDTGGTACSSCFYSRGWDATTSGNGSADYFSFGFSVEAGYAVDLASLEIGTRASGTGPGTLGLFSSLDNYAAALYTFNQAGTPSGTGNLNQSIDLSTLGNITGSVDFRIYEIGNTQSDGSGATSSSGTFRLTNYYVAGASDHNMMLTGTVAAIPEPESYALFLSGLSLIGFMVARRRG